MKIIIAISFSYIIHPCNYEMNKMPYKKLSCNVLLLEISWIIITIIPSEVSKSYVPEGLIVYKSSNTNFGGN